MTTFIQLVNDVQDGSGRMVGSSVTQVKRLVNAAFQEVALSGRLTITSASLTLVPGQGDYTVTTGLSIADLQTIKHLVTAGSGGYANYATPCSLAEILNQRSASGVNSQQPYLYSLNGDTLSMYPAPAAGDTATLWYYKRPADLSGDSDVVPTSVIPVEFHDLIVLLALSRSIRNLDKGKNGMGAQGSRMYRADYEAGLANLKRWRNRRAGSTDQAVQIGPNRRPAYANDIYFSPGDNS